MSFKCGDIVDVLEKNLNGWWRVKLSDRDGQVPAVYLKPYKGLDPVKSAMSAWELFGPSDQEVYVPPRTDFIADSSSKTTMTRSQFDEESANESGNLSSPQELSPNSAYQDFYYVLQDYEDNAGDAIGQLKQGQRVLVLDKENSSGWWRVRLDDNDFTEGWAPSAFLSVSLNKDFDIKYRTSFLPLFKHIFFLESRKRAKNFK